MNWNQIACTTFQRLHPSERFHTPVASAGLLPTLSREDQELCRIRSTGRPPRKNADRIEMLFVWVLSLPWCLLWKHAKGPSELFTVHVHMACVLRGCSVDGSLWRMFWSRARCDMIHGDCWRHGHDTRPRRLIAQELFVSWSWREACKPEGRPSRSGLQSNGGGDGVRFSVQMLH